jgi:predicted deacylase
MLSNPPIICDTPIKIGRTTINMEIAKLHTRTKIEIPIIIERAKKPGPVLLITAGIHGDEVNGVEIVRQLITKKYNKPTSGTIICIPVVNVFGFISQTRVFPDGRDLNRCFPGSKKGSLANRFAHFLMTEIVPHIDYCIDYHTGAASRFNYSQVRYNGDNPECEQLATVFGAKFQIRSTLRNNSFRQAASDAGKTVLMFEGGMALNLDKMVTKSGIEGALRVMDALKFRDFSEEIEKMKVPEPPIIITQSSWVRAKYSGLYRSYKSNGDKVSKGDKLGTISDPYGDFERTVKAPKDGYIICTNHSPIVNQGDALMHISKAYVGQE